MLGPLHGNSLFLPQNPADFPEKNTACFQCWLYTPNKHCENLRFFGSVVRREFFFQIYVILREHSAEFALKR